MAKIDYQELMKTDIYQNLLEERREFFLDCATSDNDLEIRQDQSDETIAKWIDKNYSGGLLAFDNSYLDYIDFRND